MSEEGRDPPWCFTTNWLAHSVTSISRNLLEFLKCYHEFLRDDMFTFGHDVTRLIALRCSSVALSLDRDNSSSSSWWIRPRHRTLSALSPRGRREPIR